MLSFDNELTKRYVNQTTYFFEMLDISSAATVNINPRNAMFSLIPH